jgi:hypothetical protein
LKELESIFTVERIKTKRLNMAWLEENFIKEAKTISVHPPITKEN